MELFICQYCGSERPNHNSWRNHERCCPSNPLRKYKNGMIGKKGSNQFTKSKKLGIPIPVVSKETRIKLSKSIKSYPRSYYSKASQNAILKLLKILDENKIYYGETFYASKNKEWFLSDKNGSMFCYDLCFKEIKVLIEYNGLKFHVRSLEEEWSPLFKSMGSKYDVYEKDQLKKNIAESKSFKIYYIWEDNIDNDINNIVTELKNTMY